MTATAAEPRENRELYAFGPFLLDAGERRLEQDGTPVPLTAKTFDLLLELVRAAGHLRRRDELIHALWPETVVEEHNLTANVSALRKALGDEGEAPRYIETVRGHGYRFVAPIARPPAGGGAPPARSARRPRRALWFAAAAAATAMLLAAGWFTSWRHPGAGTARPPPPAAAPARSIAVLPFQNLSADPANAYFAAGIQEMILTKLAGIRDLKVISRASTREYRSHPNDVATVARQLGVAAVLEGSVQKSGRQVLINVQLIDAHSGGHIWAHAYRRTLEDVFDVESDVAEKVAAALQAHLLPAEARRVARAPTEDPRAYDLFLRAEYVAGQIEDGKFADPAAAARRAGGLYRAAIARDPRFALAYARLSYLESYAYWFALAHTAADIAAARADAARALALDPALAQAHLAMGFVRYWGERDYAGALAQFRAARRRLPNDADVIGAIAYIERRQGRWQAARIGLAEAAVLDPRNPRWPFVLGKTLMQLRQYAAAEQQFDQALAIEPHDYTAATQKAAAFLLMGRGRDARRVLAAIPATSNPRGLVSATRFEASWVARQPARARAALAGAPRWVDAAIKVGVMPTSLLNARALALEGDAGGAQDAYRAARDALRTALRGKPGAAYLWSFLGLAEAGLGDADAALHAGRRAIALRPVSHDAFDGPSYLATLAAIYVRLGDHARAIAVLRRLLAMPAGRFVSVPLLERDPRWDPLRADPAFRRLLASPAAVQSAAAPAQRSRTAPAAATRARATARPISSPESPAGSTLTPAAAARTASR